MRVGNTKRVEDKKPLTTIPNNLRTYLLNWQTNTGNVSNNHLQSKV